MVSGVRVIHSLLGRLRKSTFNGCWCTIHTLLGRLSKSIPSMVAGVRISSPLSTWMIQEEERL